MRRTVVEWSCPNMDIRTMLKLMTRHACCFVVASLLGCGSSRDFGESVSLPQKSLARSAVAFSGGQVVALPADRPFNVADTQRHSEGAAHADSNASNSGQASCTADATEGGAASAEFQIGHVLTYDGASATKVSVTFDIDYRCMSNDHTPHGAAPPVGLKAFIKDSNHRLLGKVMLTDGNPDRLPDRWSGSQSPSFDITLEPGLAYHLIVAGRVEVSGDDTSGPRAELEVRRAEIQIAPRPN